MGVRWIDSNGEPIPYPTPEPGITWDWPNGEVPDNAYESVPNDWEIVWATRHGQTRWHTWPAS